MTPFLLPLPATACLSALLLLGTLSPAPRAGAETLPPVAAALQPYVADQVLAGAVTAVASRDKVLALDTVGYANREAGLKMPADALFWIASMSKPITGTALMMLVDEGKISLDDPVRKYLPEFAEQWEIAEQAADRVVLKKPAQPITIRQVMCHTAGLRFRSFLEQPTLDQLPLAARVRSYAAEPLLHAPASRYLYSNEGINIGGRIIEVVTGKSFEAFLDERLFQPLGMKDTTFWPSASQLPRLAVPYKPNKDKTGLEATMIEYLQYPLDDRTRHSMPGGGLFSTAADMVRYGQMLLNGGTLDGKRYLSEAAFKTMTSRQTPATLKESYGVGFAIGGDGSFGHGGALSTNLTVFPAKGIVTVFLVQHAGWRHESGKKILPAFHQTATTLVQP